SFASAAAAGESLGERPARPRQSVPTRSARGILVLNVIGSSLERISERASAGESSRFVSMRHGTASDRERAITHPRFEPFSPELLWKPGVATGGLNRGRSMGKR